MMFPVEDTPQRRPMREYSEWRGLAEMRCLAACVGRCNTCNAHPVRVLCAEYLDNSRTRAESRTGWYAKWLSRANIPGLRV